MKIVATLSSRSRFHFAAFSSIRSLLILDLEMYLGLRRVERIGKELPSNVKRNRDDWDEKYCQPVNGSRSQYMIHYTNQIEKVTWTTIKTDILQTT